MLQIHRLIENYRPNYHEISLFCYVRQKKKGQLSQNVIPVMDHLQPKSVHEFHIISV